MTQQRIDELSFIVKSQERAIRYLQNTVGELTRENVSLNNQNELLHDVLELDDAMLNAERVNEITEIERMWRA